ncbi:MAG: hypothetical protein NC911_10190, partial [Candidatus Omnitrophica bacterium]|nr:hypothetical protein [Candidatus Omnitrophota bacterium]
RQVINYQSLLGQGFSLDSVEVNNLSLRVKKAEIAHPSLNLVLKLRDFSVRPALLAIRPGGNLAFAFSGPGEISAGSVNQPLNVSGVITGNIKTGQVSINQATLKLQELGIAEVTGELTEWGKKGVSLKVELKKMAVAKLASFFKIEVPVEGLVSGLVQVELGPGEQIQKMDFDLSLAEIHARGDAVMFRGKLTGRYDLKAAKGDIQGQVEKPGGGRLNFTGDLAGENFTFRFSSEGLLVEEVLHLLPEEIKKKINLSAPGGSATLKDFVISGTKKNFL